MLDFRFLRKFAVDRSTGLIFILLLALAAGVTAQEAEEDLKIRGFGTLGMARTTTNDVEFVRDLSQARGVSRDWSPAIDSVLGLQANWRLSSEWEAVAQLNSRYNNRQNFKPAVAWAYLRHDPAPNLSLRAGRLGTDFFMQADSRWVGYSFLTVRPVGDYFWYLPFYGIHGADATLTQQFGETVIRGKVFYGHSQGEIPLANRQWSITGSPMQGVSVEVLQGDWHIRGSYADMKFSNDLPLPGLTPQESTFLGARDKRSRYYALEALYERGPWQLQLMLNHVEQGTRALESSDGGYALAGYRMATITPYLGYSWVRSKVASTSLDPITQFISSDSHSDQKTGIAGLRWDFAKDMAFKLQWDAIRGTPSSLLPYRMDNRARWDGRMDVVSATLDFVF